MNKVLLILAVSFLATTTQAQKFAYVDTDYILNKIPEFNQAQDKLDALSADWQKAIENKYADVDQMYRSYQQDQILLTDEMKIKREEAIIKKEKSAKDLQQKYFGPEGELYIKRQELIKPIPIGIDALSIPFKSLARSHSDILIDFIFFLLTWCIIVFYAIVSTFIKLESRK